MTRLAYLNKADAAQMLPKLFDILYDNMRHIAPSGCSYGQEKQVWLQEVAPALQKEPRRIVLMYADEELAGFCQYYINQGIFMVEEVQIKKPFQKTCVFFSLYRFFQRTVPQDTVYIEAWADLRNHNSIKIMQKLGMVPVETIEKRNLIHYRGTMKDIRK